MKSLPFSGSSLPGDQVFTWVGPLFMKEHAPARCQTESGYGSAQPATALMDGRGRYGALFVLDENRRGEKGAPTTQLQVGQHNFSSTNVKKMQADYVALETACSLSDQVARNSSHSGTQIFCQLRQQSYYKLIGRA